ncbi:MAG: OsmC family protein [Candidatus Methanomethyliaceae archaeon]|nr:OsmC family protein [Candidatus Methanomethyliaceae archaeon]MDW7970610.1 OsmC family protein [Nitrososphaerota archaeon]
MPRATVIWNGDLKLIGRDSLGHEVLMEAHKRYGGTGTGITPMELFLMALGGCVGLEIVIMLKARNQNLVYYEAELEGTSKEEHPKILNKIYVKFRLKGNLDDDVVDKVVNLAMSKLCPIAAMLSSISEIKWSYEIIKDEVENNT